MKIREFEAIAAEFWPLDGADDWDRPGLAVGDPQSEISGVLLSVDVTEEVIDEAVSLGANLLVTHHPLLLKGATSLVESGFKGKLVAKAIRAGLAIYSAHTNADVVEDGVSDTLAKALGLQDILPLVQTSSKQVGHGRIGKLAKPMSAAELVDLLAAKLPSTTTGIRCSLNRDAEISTVALCGGAGDAFITEAFRSGADVYITSDLRHHVASESPIGLIDVSHWAAESLWLEVAATQLASALNLPMHVCRINTDPWIFQERKN